ncbi:MAG: 4-(cytidine 5'-diphospho)-2-C-methyl-D-erythritol kinase [Ignavibacteriales bacterium]|nr:4-(cytidine 5'-diphospho)-2-C-methyl-D-erythritol kinase [Ignavibacteriales bacterium]
MLLRAYAKINLGLRVLRKRADGFHDIETVFHRINLFDEIELTACDAGISISCANENIPLDAGNLCVQAAMLFQQETNIHRGVDIKLNKIIPVGAGLGGGSSDAATVLLALSELWKIPVPFLKLRELALKLGSDVPYFLLDGTAYATGRGEVLEYFPFTVPYWIVVLFPNEQIFTKWAYQHVRVKDDYKKSIKEILLENIHDMEQLREHLDNDFEEPIFEQFPLIRDLRKGFYLSGAEYVSLSGSGSAMYGFYKDENDARKFQRTMVDKIQMLTYITPPNFTTI